MTIRQCENEERCCLSRLTDVVRKALERADEAQLKDSFQYLKRILC
jgi:hypothetical protein